MSDQELGDDIKLKRFELDDDSSSEKVQVFTNVDLMDEENHDLLVFIQKLQHEIRSGKSFEEIDATMSSLEEDSSI